MKKLIKATQIQWRCITFNSFAENIKMLCDGVHTLRITFCTWHKQHCNALENIYRCGNPDVKNEAKHLPLVFSIQDFEALHFRKQFARSFIVRDSLNEKISVTLILAESILLSKRLNSFLCWRTGGHRLNLNHAD